MQDTLKQFDAFTYFRHAESIEAVERLVGAQPGFASFEKAQLCKIANSNTSRSLLTVIATLMCTDSEEAKRLIPSLADKISDEALQILLDDIHAIRLMDAGRS